MSEIASLLSSPCSTGEAIAQEQGESWEGAPVDVCKMLHGLSSYDSSNISKLHCQQPRKRAHRCLTTIIRSVCGVTGKLWHVTPSSAAQHT
jgi:hypothetical protein